MRTVAGHHAVEVALEDLVAAFLAQFVGHVQVGNPAALLETVGVVGSSGDVGLQVHVGFRRGAHHPWRVHFDRLQVYRADLHPAAGLRRADRIFLGHHEWAGERQHHGNGTIDSHGLLLGLVSKENGHESRCHKMLLRMICINNL
ncbi:hypothetical protein D3C81_1826710 [compost metagenome]